MGLYLMTTLTAQFAIAALSAAFLCGLARNAQAQSSQAWKITTRQTDALAETRIGGMFVRLHGKCASGGPQVILSLEGYRGAALRKIDQVNQSVTFVAEGPGGRRTEHRSAVFMFGDEVSMADALPTSLVERIAESDRLLIRNASGQPILTVSLANAREFPARLARLCGAKSRTDDRQAKAGGNAAPLKGKVVRSLPLKRGFYVASDTPCGQASNATLQLLRRDGIGVARETCSFRRLEQTGPARYRVVAECRNMEGAPMGTQVSIYDIPDDSRFSVARAPGQAYSARYCIQSSLPSPWRDNDIGELIR